jgi:hypothetical protein
MLVATTTQSASTFPSVWTKHCRCFGPATYQGEYPR